MRILAEASEAGSTSRNETIPLKDLVIAPYIPRYSLSDDEKKSLIDAALEFGLPPYAEIIVRPRHHYFEVLTGIDELEAYREAYPYGKVSVTRCHYRDDQAVRIAFNWAEENRDLPLKNKIDAHFTIMTHFNWTGAELAKALRVSRSEISHRLALKGLSKKLWDYIALGKLCESHARLLCRLPSDLQEHLARRVILCQPPMPVKALKQIIKSNTTTNSSTRTKRIAVESAAIREREEKLSELVGTKVNLMLNPRKKFSGVASMEFHSIDALLGVIEKIAVFDSQGPWTGRIEFDVHHLDHLENMLGHLKEDE